MDYNPLKKFIDQGNEITKAELLENCAGAIPFHLLQAVKEMTFNLIGVDANDELYLK